MGIFNSKVEKQTQDELNTIRAARVEYQDSLNNFQTNTTSDINKKALTPETGKAIFSQIQTAYDWLKKNPNANMNEILSNKDACLQEISRLVKVDSSKKGFYNTIIAIPAILDIYQKEKLITSEESTKFASIISKENQWYTANQATATVIDFSQEMLNISNSVTTTFANPTAVQRINTDISQVSGMVSSDLQSKLKDIQVKQKNVENQTIDVKSSVNTILLTAIKIFMYFLIITLCLLSGSFAANFAIGRVPAYRVLYFLYGCMPFFAPFVLLYSIYKRVKDGRIPIYAMLPISIEPATTRLGRLLWRPFYWIPDQQAIDAFKLFNDSLPLQVV